MAKPKPKLELADIKRILKRTVPVILLVIITLIGGVIFHFIERPSEPSENPVLEAKEPERMDKLQNAVATELVAIAKSDALTQSRKKERTIQLMEYYRINSTHKEVPKQVVAQWSYLESMFYALTLYTTIGYGNMSPADTPGRVATCIYALFSIPIALVAIVELGAFFGWVSLKIYKGWRKLWKAAVNSRQVPKEEKLVEEIEEDWEDQERMDLLNFPLSLLIFMSVIWMLCTAGLFVASEGWDFGTALYFIFISYTTIGLGDIVPKNLELMLLLGIFVMIGLASVSTLISVIQEKMKALVIQLEKSMDKAYKQKLLEAEGDEGEKDPAALKAKMDKAIKDAGPGAGFIHSLLPQDKKSGLTEYLEKKASMKNSGTQTDPPVRKIKRASSIGALRKEKSKDDGEKYNPFHILKLRID